MMNDRSIKNQLAKDKSSEKASGEVLFKDRRSKRIIFVTHCLLNQNAMIDGLACYSGVVPEVAGVLLSSGCGIVQMECPELCHLGLDRQVDLNSDRTTGSEDTRVRVLMEGRSGRLFCRKMVKKLVWQMEQYLRHGFVIEGVLGTNASPTCGVETTWINGQEIQGAGVFIEELRKELAKKDILIPVKGIDLLNPGVNREFSYF